MNPETLMGLAIDYSRKIDPHLVHPNPRVGTAFLSDCGKLILGAHKIYGGDHAEIDCLKKIRSRSLCPSKGVWAVSLEPCSHRGKTPPCVDALIDAGIRQIFIGATDPNPLVNGKSIVRLRENGVEVSEGVLEERARNLNSEWHFAHENQRPYIILKLATSLDGAFFSENGQSQWITGKAARKESHKLRAQCDAIVGTVKSVESDQAKMNVRYGFERHLRKQPDLILLSRGHRWLKEGVPSDHPCCADQCREVVVQKVANFEAFFRELYTESGIIKVLIETGPELIHNLVSRGLFDELCWFKSSKILGGRGAGRISALNEGNLPGLELDCVEIRGLQQGDIFLRFKRKLN